MTTVKFLEVSMEFKDYIKTVVKRESNDFLKIKANLSVDKTLRLLHAAMGLCTECDELRIAISDDNKVNIKEELGDCFWYLGLLCDASEYYSKMFHPWSKNLNFCCCDLLDMMKKHIFYSKYVEYNDLVYCINSIYSCLINECKSFGFDPGEIMRLNDNKLGKRYGDGFSGDKAVNRDTEKELDEF
jgi:hypothetical protein